MPWGFQRTAHQGSWPSLPASGQGLLLDNLGTSLFGGEPLLVLAALVTQASHSFLTFFPVSWRACILGTVFPLSLVSRIGCSRYNWKRFIQGLVYTWIWYLRYRYLKTGLYGFGLSPSSLWTLSLPVVVVVFVSGSWLVLWCMGE